MVYVDVYHYRLRGRRWRCARKHRRLRVRPVSWVMASAYATKRDVSPPSYDTIAQETALLLTHVDHSWGSLPLSWTADWQTAPSHLRRFLSESLGLALTTEFATYYGWNPLLHLMYNIDDLPVLDKWLSGGRGMRPDFVFQTPAGLHAAESRGRSGARTNGRRTLGDQRKKARGLDDWSVRTTTPPLKPIAWSMVWAHITESETRIDHFDPGEPYKLSEDERDRLLQATRRRHQIMLQKSESSEILTILDRPGRLAVAPVGAIRKDNRTEWLCVAGWEEPLPTGAETGHVTDGTSDENSIFLSSNMGAVLISTADGSRPETEIIKNLLESAATS